MFHWNSFQNSRYSVILNPNSALLRIKSLPLKKYLTQTTSTIQWRVWLREVNLQTLINTFDALLCEGPKIKFRFGLAYLGLLIKTGEFGKIRFLSIVRVISGTSVN